MKISLLIGYSCIVRVKSDKCTNEIKSGCLTPSGLQWHWWCVKSRQNHLQACLPTLHRTWYVSNPTILLCHYKDTMPSVILVVLLHCDVPNSVLLLDTRLNHEGCVPCVFIRWCTVSFLAPYIYTFSLVHFAQFHNRSSLLFLHTALPFVHKKTYYAIVEIDM